MLTAAVLGWELSVRARRATRSLTGALVPALFALSCGSDSGDGAGAGGAAGAGAAGGAAGAAGGGGASGASVGCDVTAPTVIARTSGDPREIRVTATHVYWRSLDLASLLSGLERVPIAGGGVEVVSAADVGGVAIDEGHVYWTELSTSQIVRMPVAGGAPVPVVTGQSAFSVAAAAGKLAWVTADKLFVADSDGQNVRELGAGMENVLEVAVDAEAAYVVENTGGRVLAAPIAGGAVVELAGSEPDGILGFGINSSNVYWGVSSFGGGGIRWVPKAEGAVQTASSVGVQGMAVEEASVHSVSDGTVTSTPLDGGAERTLATTWVNLSSVATDGVCLYFADQPSGEIVRSPLP